MKIFIILTLLSSTEGFFRSPSEEEKWRQKWALISRVLVSIAATVRCLFHSLPHRVSVTWFEKVTLALRVSLIGGPIFFTNDCLEISILPNSGQWDIRSGLVEALGKVLSRHKPGSWFHLHLGPSMNKEAWRTNLLCYYDHERGQINDRRPELT